MAAVFVPLRRGIRELSGKTSSVRFPFHRQYVQIFHFQTREILRRQERLIARVLVLFTCVRSRSRQFHPRERTPGQNGRTSGKNENQPEISDDVSKVRMIVRPLGFTVLVCDPNINLLKIRICLEVLKMINITIEKEAGGKLISAKNHLGLVWL